MNDLFKNPLVLGGIVLLLVVVAFAGKAGGPTYAATSTDPAAFKARAEGQAAVDAGLTDARNGVMSAMLDYSGQRNEYRLGMAGLRADYDLGARTIDSAERLGMAGISLQRYAVDSNERLAGAQLASSERVAVGQQEVERSGQQWNFFGSLFSGVLGLFGLGR